MIKPNFFIIGAPKSGTTALSEYLKYHPSIFFSEPKELHYFNDDFNQHIGFNYEKYLSHFANATEQHTAIGEGSVFYLYSKTAVPQILKNISNPKFIVMLRNPIELVPALHMQAIHSHAENVLNLEQAWQLEAIRKTGKSVPKLTMYPQALWYGDLAKLGQQLKRLFDIVPRNTVHIIVFDDFKKNTQQEYSKVLDFLEVEHRYPDVFNQINISKAYKSIFIKSCLDFVPYIKKKLSITKSTGWGNKLLEMNTYSKKRDPISDAFEQELKVFFYEDVKLLSDLLNRNLLAEWDF